MAAARAEQRPAATARPAPAGPARRPDAPSREEAPAESARAGHAFGRVRLHPGPVPAVQPRLTISQPGDPFEQEAERVADEVMRASAEPSVVEQESEDDSVQTARDPAFGAVAAFRSPGPEEDEELDERLPSPVELDAPAGEEAVQRAVRPDGKEEDEEEETEGEETLHRHAASGDDPPARRRLGGGGLARELASARAGGRPLPTGARGSMERAFNADFSAVRIHDDPTAHRLSRSVHALAFTNREHIFFAPGRFDPGSGEGRRLLAHELTHVVQQVPSVRGGAPFPAPSPSPAVQRAPAPAGPVLVARGEQVQRAPGGTGGGKGQKKGQKKGQGKKGAGQRMVVASIRIEDESGALLLEEKVLMEEHPGALGTHEATVSGRKGSRRLDFGGAFITLDQEPDAAADAFARAGRITITFLPPGTGSGGGTKDGGAKESAPGGEKTEGGETGGGKTGKPGGTGTPDRPGSKYGWLGLLELDQETIDLLEKAFEALEDEEEYLALRDTLESLAELGKHASTLESWFSDTDQLLAVALGLEDNAAVSAVEGWVNRKPPRRKVRVGSRKLKGITAVARKVAAVIEKVRRILHPVFRVRASFVSLFGSVESLMEGMSLVQELPDELGRGKLDAPRLLEALSSNLAATMQHRMEALRQGFAVRIESFGEEDLVTSQEIGRALVSAGLKAAPGPAKLAAKLGSRIPGLEELVADHLVAPLIPQAALDALNERLVSLAALLEPAARQAASDLDAIFAGLEDELAASLARETKSFAALLHGGAGGGRAPRSETRFRSMLGASRGEALPEGVRQEMEGHLGFDFGRVRIHRDGAAERAAEAVNANAFALGTDLFFGPGRYDPSSPAGRRLLAHELTHVVQQDGAGEPVVQRDFKALRKKIIARVGERARAALKIGTGGSAAKQRKARRIRDRELPRLFKQRVVRNRGPALPEAYFYVRVRGRITAIHRRLTWIRLVPALSFDDKGYIRLAAEFGHDPKDADRAALRRACRCAPGRQAHHVLPLEVRDHPIARLAEANGFKYNGTDNGVCLTKLVHDGSHPNYTGKVRRVLRGLQVAHPGNRWTPALRKAFHAEVADLHTYCKRRRSRLD